MGVVSSIVGWVGKAARSVGLAGGLRGGKPTMTPAASALRPYFAGSLPGLWSSDHTSEALKYTGWTYCAVSALADQAMQAQYEGYLVGRTRDKDTGRIRKNFGQNNNQADRIPLRDKHPLMRLLNRPNPEQTGAKFRYQAMQQLSLTGTCHIMIVRNGADVPVELYIIPTGSAVPLPPSTEYPRGAYRISPLASFASTIVDDYLPTGSLGPLLTVGGTIDGRMIKSVRLDHPLYRSDGWSPLSAGALTIDVEEQLNRARWYSFKNASTPGMVLELAEDAQPSPEEMEAFRADLRNRNAGTQNAGKDLLLPPGVTAKQITSSNKEMDYTSSYPQVRDASLAFQKTPAVAVGVSEAGSYAAYYASLLQFTELAVQPRLSMLAEELTEALAPDFERATGLPDDEHLVVELKARSISDPSIERDEIQQLITGKAITINELRARKGMPPIEWGDCPAGTDPVQWKQGMQQLKQGAQGGQGAPGGNPLAAMLGGGAGGPPGGGGELQPGADAGPAAGQEGEEDDPFAALFSGGNDGADTPIGEKTREGGGVDVSIGELSRESGDEDGPNLEDPVRGGMPKAPTNRMRKGYVRLDLVTKSNHGSNGYHAAGTNGRAGK